MNAESKRLKWKSSFLLTGKDFLIAHKEVLFQCVLAMALILLGTYRIGESTMPILLDDEYGYWSNSAFFTGDNWSSVTSKIGYYSYGYSLLLAPIRLFAKRYDLTWEQAYQLAQLVNVFFLVVGFFLAIQLCKRYMKNLDPVVRSMACFAVMVYSSNLFYAHISFTECTLNGVFWIFLYLMMRVIDKPSIINHMGYAVTAFYIYTVHQRALAVLITSVIVVFYLKLVKKNTLRHMAAFGITFYLCSLIHSVIKGTLQNVCYRGNEFSGWADSLTYMFTKKAALLLVAGLAVFLLLYLFDKGKIKLVLCVAVAGVAVGAVYLVTHTDGLRALQMGTVDKIAINDFSGQWEKIAGFFTKSGVIRLGTSIVGKWFYLVSATGLVICWGMRDLFGNFFLMLADSAKRVWSAVRKREYIALKGISDDNQNDRIWYVGVFLAWIGTFLICAIYKEGFYKNDDFFNGRYHEFVIGILLLYSLNILIQEKRWLITAFVSLGLYLAAAWFCQFAVDELQRTSFELAHSVLFGRVIWNYEAPTGRVWVLSRYVLILAAAFFVVFKVGNRFVKSHKVVAARCVLALLIPIFSWVHIAVVIVDNYVVVRNINQEDMLPTIAWWTDILSDDEPVYFVQEYLTYRYSALLQFMLRDNIVIMTHIDDTTFDEDACYIMDKRYLEEEPHVLERCKVIVTVQNLALVINKDQKLNERWEKYEAIFR